MVPGQALMELAFLLYSTGSEEEEEMPKSKRLQLWKSLRQACSWEARSLFTFLRGSSPCAGLSNGVGGPSSPHSLLREHTHALLHPCTHL